VGVAGDLHVRVASGQRADAALEIAFADLRVVEVQLQRQVRLADAIDDRQRLGGGAQEIAGVVDRVERLDQHRHALGRSAARGVPEIRHVRLQERGTVGARRDVSRHRVDALRPADVRVRERRTQGGSEVGLAAGQRGQTALAGRPVARRQIEEHQRQVVRVELRAHARRRQLIRKEHFDGAKSGLRRSSEPFDQRQFGEQPREVRGQSRHATRYAARRTASASRRPGSRRRRPGEPW
jgi:hypothetical protein